MKKAIFGGIGGFILMIGLFAFMMCWDFVDNYQTGYKFNTINGEITVLDSQGWFLTPPFVVKIHKVDMRPQQVCINANKRVLNCKLVQFDPAGLRLFISWHGRDNYEMGSDHTGSFSDILKSYAYDGSNQKYPFLRILKELSPAGEVVYDVPK